MKYVLVTGAYGGMGKAVTDRLVALNYHVIALDKVIGKPKDNVYPVECDLSDIKSVESALTKVKSITDNLYAIMHFAGIYALDSLIEISEEKIKKVFEVNFFGVYRVNKVFLPLLSKNSRILITTSELAPLDPLPFTGVYAISKSLLDKYAYSLRMEVQLLGIKVSVLRPGAVMTDMLGISTLELDKFCANSSLYQCNAKRFKNIVNKVEAGQISAKKLAKKAVKIIGKKRPSQVYNINRNFLLLLLNVLPKKLQTKIIKWILSN